MMAERAYVSFAEVKQQVSIPDVLEVFEIAEGFVRKGKTLAGVCPLPSHNHGPNPNPEQFKINLRNGVWLWHCFGDCQRGGDVIEFVKAMTGYDNSHVRFWFAENFGERLTLRKQQESKRSGTKSGNSGVKSESAQTDGDAAEPVEPPEGAMSAVSEPARLKPLRFHLNLEPCVPYLYERGLKAETIQRFGLGLCNKGYLKGYVAIPVYAYPQPAGTNPIGYLGRWPAPDASSEDDEETEKPRYKFPVDFPRNRIVYGLSLAMDTADDLPLVVVEGPFKVYHLYQAGFRNAVATFGASLSVEQAAILAGTGRPVVLMFDGDEAGQQGMRTAAAKLITQTFVRVVKLPPHVEPDDLSQSDLKQLLR